MRSSSSAGRVAAGTHALASYTQKNFVNFVMAFKRVVMRKPNSNRAYQTLFQSFFFVGILISMTVRHVVTIFASRQLWWKKKKKPCLFEISQMTDRQINTQSSFLRSRSWWKFKTSSGEGAWNQSRSVKHKLSASHLFMVVCSYFMVSQLHQQVFVIPRRLLMLMLENKTQNSKLTEMASWT